MERVIETLVPLPAYHAVGVYCGAALNPYDSSSTRLGRVESPCTHAVGAMADLTRTSRQIHITSYRFRSREDCCHHSFAVKYRARRTADTKRRCTILASYVLWSIERKLL